MPQENKKSFFIVKIKKLMYSSRVYILTEEFYD